VADGRAPSGELQPCAQSPGGGLCACARWSWRSYSVVSGGGLYARVWQPPVNGVALMCGELQGGVSARGRWVLGGLTFDGGLSVQCSAVRSVCPNNVRSALDGCGRGRA
jgi:hypothetical protein